MMLMEKECALPFDDVNAGKVQNKRVKIRRLNNKQNALLSGLITEGTSNDIAVMLHLRWKEGVSSTSNFYFKVLLYAVSVILCIYAFISAY